MACQLALRGADGGEVDNWGYHGVAGTHDMVSCWNDDGAQHSVIAGYGPWPAGQEAGIWSRCCWLSTAS